MAEVREFALPDLGEGLTEATITHWLVDVGEVVAVDQPVVEVETAKAMVEVPCPHAGVITARYGDEGDEVPVGTPLVTVAVGAEPGTAAAAPTSGNGAEPARTAGERTGADSGEQGSGNVLVGYGTQAPSGRRRGRVRGGPHPPGGPAVTPGRTATPPAAPQPAATAPGDVGGEAAAGTAPPGA
ncbi:biotin/lipoyl-containing protein, partial [Streptomyces sp. JJ36]|uniref:biotin/lipoyl-containing protein n=1 Tax=Streptomyces sp. JJ36 TaxID=2736645 RepID=UPI002795F752